MMSFKKWIILSVLTVIPFLANSQFRLTEAGKQKGVNEKNITKNISSIVLPFIEDFSNYRDIPNPNLWENSGVWVNFDYPVFPPTVGVVTFDALDSQGQLYQGANTTGFPADTLTSCKIRLDSILLPTPTKLNPQDSIYLSFYVQPGGGIGDIWDNIGATPAKKDSLVLQFYSISQNTWHNVWKIEGLRVDSIFAKDSTYWVFINIPIVDTIYFNSEFRFRFLNFASLSNNPSYAYVDNCDHWHLDYIYLNKDRRYDDRAIRDIAFVNPARSLLKEYQAMPALQFSEEDMGDSLSIKIINLSDIALSSQYNYYVFNSFGAEVASYNGGFENIYPYIQTKNFQTSPNHANPPINFSYSLNPNQWETFDVVHIVKEGVGQDSRTSNDTISFKQVFENYFAYDDASAENGFGIEPITVSNLALGFNLRVPDTLTAVDIYFNSTYQDANQKPFYLCVWNSLGGKPNDSIYRSHTYLTPTTEGLNQYTRYYLDSPLVIPEGEFFVSLQTKYSDYLNLGFDRNTDCSSKMFGNWSNSWEPNTLFKGSLMIRPYFGYKALIGLEEVEKEELNFSIYPNPTNSTVNLKINNSNNFHNTNYKIRIINMLGKEVYSSAFKTQIDVSALSNGVYILYIIDTKTHQTKQEKLIIQK